MASFRNNDTGYDNDTGYVLPDHDSAPEQVEETEYNTYHHYEDTESVTREDLLLALQTLEEGNEADEEQLSPAQEKLHDNLNFSMYSEHQLIFSVLGQTAMISHGQLWIQASYPRVDNESHQKTTYRLLQFLLTGGTVYMQAGGPKWGHKLLVHKEDEEEEDSDEEDSDEEEDSDVDSEEEEEDSDEEEEVELASPLEEYLRIFQELSEETPDFSKNSIHRNTVQTMEALDIDTSNFQTRQEAVRAFAEFLGISEPPIADAVPITN